MPERFSFIPLQAENFKIYKKPDEKIGCDKGSHRLRSEANDKRKGKSHREHFKRRNNMSNLKDDFDQDDDGCNTEDDHELQDWRDELDYLEDMAESAHS